MYMGEFRKVCSYPFLVIFNEISRGVFTLSPKKCIVITKIVLLKL